MDNEKFGNSEGSLGYDMLVQLGQIARLESTVVEAAVQHVRGVGYDGNSLQSEQDATQQFVNSYNALIASTKALISARREAKQKLENAENPDSKQDSCASGFGATTRTEE